MDRILKRHDTAVMPRAKFLDEDGAAVDLTGATVVYTLREWVSKRVKILRQTATVRDQVLYLGEVYYPWMPTDVNTAGDYEEEWEITYSGGSKESFPVGTRQKVRIEADYDNT